MRKQQICFLIQIKTMCRLLTLSFHSYELDFYFLNQKVQLLHN